MIGALMLDIAGTTLTQEDIELLGAPQVGGVILFGRNIESPAQVRALTDHMRQVRPDILIAVDQEGGRVQRLKQGFTLLPAMGKFGELYQTDREKALELAEKCGWLMATEVLAVGIDFSFAPVLDLNDISDVIGDRSFAKNIQDIIPLAGAFLKGMKRAGMASTGKHFPGHGSVKADSHVAAAIDMRSYEEIQQRICRLLSSYNHNSMRLCLPMLSIVRLIQIQPVSQNSGFRKCYVKNLASTAYCSQMI